ncbi:SDR family NAD(P)-dependent oxidoreductase [Micromonosporaceae bacterium Da 78-11]
MTQQSDSEVSGTDIAIVGMSGRFPGAADVAGLWATLRAGQSGMTHFTDEELRAAGVAEELLADPAYVKAGGVVDGIEEFDAGFFGVGPKEAQILDPQQRLFLEHTWQALEDAGCDPSRFGGAIGVFGGSAWSSYLQNNLAPSGIAAAMGDLALGLANDKDSLTTRVAHTLGLTGPSYSVQSYCSTSLVAVCAAATSLAGFECDMALAGGVNVAVPHRVGYLYQEGGIVPPDGECRPFDAAGLGAPVGSGVGVVALRRLEDAQADGDRIYAVIRGWAVNNDGGHKVGFTAPGVRGQAAVIAEALSSANLSAADVDYVEAHGTGTALGDASELAALQQVFHGERCLIGSVKSNVGHLDRAAGVTGLIKASLALRNGEIPPSRNLRDPNRQLRTGEAHLEVVTELRQWPRSSDRVRHAGVSAFGIGGTNAHVVLGEAPLVERPAPAPRPELLVWSARTAAAADELTTRLAGYLTGNLAGGGAAERLSDVAYTLQAGRRVFDHRRIAVASSTAEAAGKLAGAEILAQTGGRENRAVGLLIAGTGEQYPGMAADLYATEPVFRAAIEQCRAVLIDRLGGLDPLTDMLRPRTADRGADLRRMLGRGTAGANPGDATDLLQPATFAVGYALARLVGSWGIEPVVLAGYSLGEYVAACLAGVFTLESALALVAYRAQLISTLPAGAMIAVALPDAEVQHRIARCGLALDIAAVNGAELTVVSGDPASVAAFGDALRIDGVPVRPLATTHAFHSRMLAGVRDQLTGWVTANVELSAPAIPYLSNLTGALITEAQATDPGYWAEHMCAPVRFDQMLDALLDQGDLALLEIGPGQSLGVMVRGRAGCPKDRWSSIVPTLPAAADPRPAAVVLAEAVGRLWLAGVPIDWAGYQQGRPVGKVGVPGYPFQRERYWIDAPAAANAPAPPGRQDPGRVALLTPRWASAPLGDLPAPAGVCVLVGAASPTTAALLDALGEQDVEASRIDDIVQLDPAAATVVDLRLLDDPAPDPDGRGAVLPVAALIAAIGGGVADSVRLILAGRGGQAVTASDHPAPAPAALAALPAVAGQEYLDVDCRLVDLDPTAGVAATARALADEIGRSSTDVLVAYRDGIRYVREFTPTPTGPAVPIVPGGSYLVTGGLGDVGLRLAEHLATRGAGRVVLTGRSGEPPAGDVRHDALDRVRALGAEIVVVAADVTDAEQMRALFASAGRLDGVIHAAAQTGPDTFRPLRDLDDATVAQHFGAKVTGALVLAEVIDALPPAGAPDFCVLFSSTSALLGGLAFGSYAAANAALTAIGQRAAAGAGTTRWVAANWDTWAGNQDRVRGGVGATMAAHSMTTEQGLAAFDRLLTGGGPSIVVAVGGLTDRLPQVAAVVEEPVATGTRFARPDLPQPYSPPLSNAERALAELWSEVLGVEPVGARDNFFDLSGNSLLALQMLALVKKRFGVAVPSVTLFEAPTVHALAAVLDQQGAVLPGRPGTSVAAPAAAPVPQVPTAGAVPDTDRRIAVVGMAGRFPGAGDVATFWQNLCGGVESISFFSEEELIASGVSAETLRDPAYVPARPVLDDVAGFDAAFFGISPRMAALTDPQQRMFIEVCWEALEQAGYAAPEHRGRVGVYGGNNISTYLLGMPEETILDGDVSTYEVIMGNDKDALTTTVSYLFDLHGPSVAVQTFCSTSLVATHLAMQSLRSGECELALAGGVSIRVPDKVGHTFGPGGMESPDGHVRTFDAKARGSMFGDGAAVVVLKRLSDALRDGDHIWSVIRGSAINNDGSLKVGYTAPSVIGQSRVVVDALADAGVTGADINYVEAHGTATELGDPIEVAALTRAFGATGTRQYCPIGSVKTNIGHLDRAAGVTGLIKTSLALRDEVIPASLHYTSPNPDIDFENSPFYVNTELSRWEPRDGRPRIAGINSLGMGGTNVHVVVEQAPVRGPAGPVDERTRRFQMVGVSARNATAADESVARLAGHLRDTPDVRLADVAYTLQVGRKTFEHRRALVASNLAEVTAALSGDTSGPALLSRMDAVRGRPVALVFTGVGEQYPGMAAELYRREPVFRAALDECVRLLGRLLPGVDLLDLLTGARSAGPGLAALLGRAGPDDDPRAARLRRSSVVQPALFALEYALARTLLTWGVRPAAMLGYSLGEYVAACLAGVLSLPDALALVSHRATLIDELPAGAMYAVSLPAEELAARFGLDGRGLDVAALNGPQVTVVAGPVPAVDALTADLRRAGIAGRPLATTHAFHSRMLAPAGAALTAWVSANITLHPPQVPYLSNVTGDWADAALVCDPGYWAAHMSGPVRFAAGVDALLADPELAIVEIGPGQSLGALMRTANCPPQRWPMILSTLPAAGDGRADDATLTDCLARLWLLGVELDWSAYHHRTPGAEVADPAALPGRVPLPTYPFQRQRYWVERAVRGERSHSAARALPRPGEAPDVGTLDMIAGLPKLGEDQWLYLPVWRQTAALAVAVDQPAHWLVYTGDGVAAEVVAGLRDGGVDPRLVRPGDSFTASDGGYTVRPGNVDDTLALLRALRAAGQEPQRVVHLWALAPASGEDVLTAGLHTLVALARAAGELGMTGWSLDVAVAGTQQVIVDDVANPHAATLTGPCRVIPLEYPTVTTRMIDLDPMPGPGAVPALVAELHRPMTDPLVALRHGRRWLPGHDLMAVPETVPTGALRPGGVYLITGGLGGIALGLAEQLARECRPKLVLLARNGLPPRDTWAGLAVGGRDAERIAKVTALLELGAEVEIVVGDVSDPDAVRRACDMARERFGALHGVLHVAGVPGMGLMQFKEPAELDQVLAPKMAGALAITDALRMGKPDEIDLDFLVFFSSITSATGGGPGQVDYCAANAFLDSYACQLAASGRRVLSVGWGEWKWNAWSDGLAGYADSLQEFFTANRSRIGIDAADGWRSLLRALQCAEPRVVVSTQDFPTVVGFSSQFTVDAVTSPELAPDGGARHPRPELVTAYQEPSGPVESMIAAIWCDSLRLERVGAADNFFELGGNSLLGVTIVAALRAAFGLAELPPHILYEAPTVAALGRAVEAASSGGRPAGEGTEGDSHVRAQLRRSGLEASAGRRRR